jgi:hypothetical protein
MKVMEYYLVYQDYDYSKLFRVQKTQPQISFVSNDIGENLRENLVCNIRDNKKIETELLLKYSLNKGCKYSDFISFPYINQYHTIIISKKVKEIFDQFKIQKSHLYQATVGTKDDYYLLQLLSETYSNIDKIVQNNIVELLLFDEFRKQGFTEDNVLSEFHEFISKFKNKFGSKFNIRNEYEIFLNNGFKNIYDLLYIPFIDNVLFISESLKNKLVEANTTGIKFVKGSVINYAGFRK